MRDKQAFEAYVLEKSKIEKNKIAMRRKTILTAGMSLCACLVVLMVLPGILEQTGNSSDRVPEAWPVGGSNQTTPVPTIQNVVGGTEDEGDGSSEKVEATEKNTPMLTQRPTKRPTTKPAVTSEINYGGGVGKPQPPGSSAPQEALPLDEAFAQKKSDYAIPDRINEMTEVTTIRQICDWVMNGDFQEGTQPETIACTMTIYYGQDSFTCYLTEEGFFKIAEGDWLKTDPAYMARLMDILEVE